MGVKKWDGTPLTSGYGGMINGKEFELDSPTSKAEMPSIKGKDPEYENDLEFGSPPRSQAHDLEVSHSTPARVVSASISNSPAASKPYVTPTASTSSGVSASSFYALKPARAKTAGPL